MTQPPVTDPSGAQQQFVPPAKMLPAAYVPNGQAAAAEAAAISLQAGTTQPGMPAPGEHGVEEVPVGPYVQFMGRVFHFGGTVPAMALLDFAAESAKGVGELDVNGLAVMRDLIRRCFLVKPPCRNVCPRNCKCAGTVHCAACTDAGELAEEVRDCAQYDAGEWPRFRMHALDTGATPEQMLDVVTAVIQQGTGRPT
jgi:hypothetical protein